MKINLDYYNQELKGRVQLFTSKSGILRWKKHITCRILFL